MNHSSKGEATVTPFKPLLVNSQWRLGFIATRDLQAGEELTWDYGCAPCGIEWLKKRPKMSAPGEHNAGSSVSCAPSPPRPVDAFEFILSETKEAPLRHRGVLFC